MKVVRLLFAVALLLSALALSGVTVKRAEAQSCISGAVCDNIDSILETTCYTGCWEFGPNRICARQKFNCREACTPPDCPCLIWDPSQGACSLYGQYTYYQVTAASCHTTCPDF